MKWILTVALVAVCVLSFTAVDFASAATTGAFQLGLGAANITGSSYIMTGAQVVTLQASGLIFPTERAMVLVGFSYGFQTEYEYKSENESGEFGYCARYIDGMIGTYKSFQDGGFLYFGGGVTLGWGEYGMGLFGDSGNEFDLKTTIGFVLGAGVSLPVTDTFMGFVNARQRFIKSEVDLGEEFLSSLDASIGGLEMTLGLAWKFGG